MTKTVFESVYCEVLSEEVTVKFKELYGNSELVDKAPARYLSDIKCQKKEFGNVCGKVPEGCPFFS